MKHSLSKVIKGALLQSLFIAPLMSCPWIFVEMLCNVSIRRDFNILTLMFSCYFKAILFFMIIYALAIILYYSQKDFWSKLDKLQLPNLEKMVTYFEKIGTHTKTKDSTEEES